SGIGAAVFANNLFMAFVARDADRDLYIKMAPPAFPGRGVVALQLTVEDGRSKLVPVWATDYWLNYQPGSPYVTSNGSDDALVWVADRQADNNLPIVRAFHAVTGEELYNSERRPGAQDRPSWPGCKFCTTVVVDGKLFLGTQKGVVTYGILPE